MANLLNESEGGNAMHCQSDFSVVVREKLKRFAAVALVDQAAQKQAEPGADERAAFEAACRKLADMPEESFDTSWGDDELNAMWALWKEARATHPEASAPGLSDEELIGILRNEGAWPELAIRCVREIRERTRANAATVAEPSWTTDHPENTGVGDYCQPGDGRKPRWILLFDDADRSMGVYESEQEARTAFARAEGAGWNCWLFSPTLRAAQQQAEPGEGDAPMIFMWFARGTGNEDGQFIRAWTSNAARVKSLQDAIGKPPIAYVAAHAEPGVNEGEAFAAAMRAPEFHQAGDATGWLGVARYAWLAALKFAAQSSQRAGDEHSPSLPVIQRMMQTLTKCGVSYGEGGAEMFFARLDDNIYALCRAVDSRDVQVRATQERVDRAIALLSNPKSPEATSQAPNLEHCQFCGRYVDTPCDVAPPDICEAALTVEQKSQLS